MDTADIHAFTATQSTWSRKKLCSFLRVGLKGLVLFPINNIALRLWLEVVEWYANENTTTMRYMNETKSFWKVGWRLFGGK